MDKAEWIKRAMLQRWDQVSGMIDQAPEITDAVRRSVEFMTELNECLEGLDKQRLHEWLDVHEEIASLRTEMSYTKGFHDGAQLVVYLMQAES